MAKGTFVFTDTDRAIVAELRRNGRATNQQIAETLGLTATTVSTRIRRMEDANQLRVVAVADFSALGYTMLLRLAIEVEGRPTSDVAQDLAAMPDVFAAHIITGRYDIDLLVALRDFADLSGFLRRLVADVPGLRSITPSIVVDIVKYKFDVAPIEGDDR